MQAILSDIAIVKAGHPFRGTIPKHTEGNAHVVQIRDIDNDGFILWDQLIQTMITGRKCPDWLKTGDVLFAARGQRNIAACIDKVDTPTICAAHYFLIQVQQPSTILPQFLAWQLNQEKAKRYFAQSAEGSSQVSIRRTVLESTPLFIPTIQEQQAIVALDRKAKQEKRVLNALINNRAQQMQAIARELLAGTLKTSEQT
ncbi:restriction endonuclease subunit S [uncultured Pseudoteredinibacter sp.]|uniref:restriction endonuclease subunit S n=1 Tax=uncultured Pseudoteredinibacter sp. TaxID=1641701 RepID=UPI0026129891|nr:restriction endonuclease subunit S [uncultured Pseudoteredinibacter sp.]